MNNNSTQTPAAGNWLAALTPATVLCSVLIVAVSTGCSIRRFAVNKLGDALASGGTTYESDEDIQLVGQALPFGLKLMESED